MKYHFLHINKTSGVSIRKWFIDNGYRLDQNNEWQTDHKIINDINDKDLYFTVVRNPYSRIVSQFLHWKDNLNRLKDCITFKDYILNLNSPSFFVKKEHLHKYQKKFHMPCSYWIKSDKFKIFKFENIENLVEYFVNNHGFKNNFPRLNTTDKNNSMSYFDKETLKIVNEIMQPDFHNFNYKMRQLSEHQDSYTCQRR